jgi:hypothetical protein
MLLMHNLRVIDAIALPMASRHLSPEDTHAEKQQQKEDD